jgi:hypothetical protein
MKPTKLQLKVLKFYANYETKPLTLLNILYPFRIQWVLLILIAVAGRWYIWAGWPQASWILIGLSIGAFLRDIARIQILYRTWPVLHEIINWERVKDLMQNNAKDTSKSSPTSN